MPNLAKFEFLLQKIFFGAIILKKEAEKRQNPQKRGKRGKFTKKEAQKRQEAKRGKKEAKKRQEAAT